MCEDKNLPQSLRGLNLPLTTIILSSKLAHMNPPETERIYHFEAVIDKPANALGWSHIVFPFNVESEFGVKGTVRILGTLNGIEFDRALMPCGDGDHLIIIGPEIRRAAKIQPGSTVKVVLWRNPNPNALNLPEELVAALEQVPEAQEAFEKLKPGMKRSIVYWIDSAKRPETRVNRAVEVLRRFESGTFYFGESREKRKER
jgi:hypothetical protein